MVPSYREHGASLLRGLPLKQSILYWDELDIWREPIHGIYWR